MDLHFLAKADHAALQLEIARASFENARAQLEIAKENFEELLPQADELGIPRAKLKKLTEDRVRGLMESGMLTLSASVDQKKDKPRKARKAPEAEGSSVPEGENDFLATSGEASVDLAN